MTRRGAVRACQTCRVNTRPVELRATTFADAELVSSWVSSPEELLTFAGPKLHFPLDPQALLDTSLEGWQVRSLFFEGRLVGTGSFTLRDGAVHLGRLMVDPQRRGEGLGRVLVTELLEHALCTAQNWPAVCARRSTLPRATLLRDGCTSRWTSASQGRKPTTDAPGLR